ncbi:hypothetical protein JW824_00180 [bacterium]|nr:hypothetical protein [bacterium]
MKKRIISNDWGKIIIEILKWSFIIWLLWPLSRLSQQEGLNQFTRVLFGILLFIIFTGKVFYDTVIMGWIKQRRTSIKQDAMMLVGMVLVLCLILGLVVFLVGLYLSEVSNGLQQSG